MITKASLRQSIPANWLWPAVNGSLLALTTYLAWRVIYAPFSSGWVLAANEPTLNGIVLFSGKIALILLLLSLACTPLARILGWNEVIKVRKSLGLWAFGFALFHSLFFLQGKAFFTRYDIGFTLWQVGHDMFSIVRYGSKVPHAEAGIYALALLLPLALTSNRLSMRYLGKNWKRLHRLVYLAAPVAVWHYWWRQESIFDNTPPDYWQPTLFGAATALLLLMRAPPVRRWLMHFLRLEKQCEPEQQRTIMSRPSKFLIWLLLLPLALVACQPIRPLPKPTHSNVTGQTPCRPTVGQPLRSASAAPETLSSRLQLASEDEPGERLLITGIVYAADCRTPLAGASLRVWQADATGVYGDLAGTLRTDANGRYELYTVKPGYYAGERNPPPLHIHFQVAHPEARDIESEFLFADDPLALAIRGDFSTQMVKLQQATTTDGALLHGVFNIVLAEKQEH